MRFRSFAGRMLVLASLLAVAWVPAAGQTAGSQESSVMATIHQFVDGFNRGDTKSALAACATQASIIDEFPPHEWLGPSACDQWAADYAATGKQQGITDGNVTLGKPWYVNVAGDRAYVVVPATYAYKEHGKPVTERDSIFTVALRRFAAGWRITGWAWSRH
jgi:ketosteroid isomerase-like protein